jgi:hypothetical protein
VQRTRTRTKKKASPAAKKAAKKAVVRTQTTKKPAKKTVRSIPRVAHRASTSDSVLLAGGLALVILVLGDTIFLALSSRYLRA